jgi:hypothetical protein
VKPCTDTGYTPAKPNTTPTSPPSCTPTTHPTAPGTTWQPATPTGSTTSSAHYNGAKTTSNNNHEHHPIQNKRTPPIRPRPQLAKNRCLPRATNHTLVPQTRNLPQKNSRSQNLLQQLPHPNQMFGIRVTPPRPPRHLGRTHRTRTPTHPNQTKQNPNLETQKTQLTPCPPNKTQPPPAQKPKPSSLYAAKPNTCPGCSDTSPPHHATAGDNTQPAEEQTQTSGTATTHAPPNAYRCAAHAPYASTAEPTPGPKNKPATKTSTGCALACHPPHGDASTAN